MSTAIEWTDETWNPTVGCTKISPGCKHCYADTLHAQRAKALAEGKKMPSQYAHPFEVLQLMPDRLEKPLTWRKPRRIFVNSVSDLFHPAVPFEFVDRVFAVMALAPQHTFQVLTKRPERMAEWFQHAKQSCRGYAHGVYGYLMATLKATQPDLYARTMTDERREFVYRTWHPSWPYPPQTLGQAMGAPWPLPNVWLGTSVENQKYANRAQVLGQIPAAVRFISAEPLLEAIPALPLEGIHWVIVGGESGNGARSMELSWAQSLVDQCAAASMPCFVKQLGSAPTIDGRPYGVFGKNADPDLWPSALRVRQFPEAAR